MSDGWGGFRRTKSYSLQPSVIPHVCGVIPLALLHLLSCLSPSFVLFLVPHLASLYLERFADFSSYDNCQCYWSLYTGLSTALKWFTYQ